MGEFLLYDVVPGSVKESRRSPEDYGLSRCKPEDLAGGDADHNAKELVRVFRGDDDGAHRDALLLGTSLVLEVTGVVDNPRDGVQLAANAIDSGKTGEFLDSFREHFSS